MTYYKLYYNFQNLGLISCKNLLKKPRNIFIRKKEKSTGSFIIKIVF